MRNNINNSCNFGSLCVNPAVMQLFLFFSLYALDIDPIYSTVVHYNIITITATLQ